MTKQDIITYGFKIISVEDKAHKVDDGIFVRDITVKKPRGKRTYIISCQCDRNTGEILNYVTV